jgi:hypothetical protein
MMSGGRAAAHFAALAMIAQRKPNQDKGFEDLRGSGADIARKLQFSRPATFN